jgi:hypothetical protein
MPTIITQGCASAEGFGFGFKKPSLPISVFDIASQTVGNGSTTNDLTVPTGGVPAKSLIVVGISEFFVVGGGSVTDSVGNTYIALPFLYADNSSGRGFSRVFYAYNSLALSAGQTITYNHASASRSSATAFYAINVQTSADPLDNAVTVSGTNSPNSISLTSGTPSVSGELFLGFVGVATNTRTSTYIQDTANGWSVPPSASSGFLTGVCGGTLINNGTGTKTFAPTDAQTGTMYAAQWIYGFKPA